MTVQIHKKKKTNHSDLFERARNELETLEKQKSEIINELAEELLKLGEQYQTISTTISKELKGFVTARYVQETLPPEYKSPKHVESANHGKNRRTSSPKQALPQLETEPEDTEIYQDTLENLMSLPKWQEQIERIDLISCRRLLKDAIRRYTAAKDQIRALNSDRQQFSENPRKWHRNQKMAKERLGGLVSK